MVVTILSLHLYFCSFWQTSMFLHLYSSRSSWRLSTGVVQRSLARYAGNHPQNSNANNNNNNNNNLISSTQSTTIKKIQALLTKRRKRVELQQVVVEGPRMIMDLWKNACTRPLIRQIVVDESKWDEQFASQFNNDNVVVLSATSYVLKSCTDTVTNQGIIAVCDIPKYELKGYKGTTEEVPCQSPMLYLVLDGVSDPGNTGTLLRSAVATGIRGVIFLPDSCDPWNPKAVRSAMGTTFHLPVVQTSSWEECFALLQSIGCQRTFAATMLSSDCPGMSHYEVDWIKEPTALIIGSEGNGLSIPVRQAIENKDVQAVYVPMKSTIESLNAAVCGSVILFEQYRQNLLL